VRRLVTGQADSTVSGHDFTRADSAVQSTLASAPEQRSEVNPAGFTVATHAAPAAAPAPALPPETGQRPSRSYIYPHWPWWRLLQWIRAAFIELVMRPLVWFLANPRVVAPPALSAGVSEPILIVANHSTAYDGPLVQYALPVAPAYRDCHVRGDTG
jgi:hypothetical protein